jgi:dipeptidyl aminopeptidase/acylaminoacyl peptidase
MMPTDRFERRLPGLLTELAEPRTPDYLDDLLWQTAHTSQRPAWSLIERWLPMVDVARQPVLAPRIPWRSVGLAVVLIALLVAAAAVALIGTRPRLPEPFGLARNGLIAYAADGDIYTVDPATGAAIAAVTGPETDLEPVWSLDGTRFAFERKVAGATGPGLLFVAGPDGTELIQVTPESLAIIESYAFSPDGTELLIQANPTGLPSIFIAKSDGTGIRMLEIGMPAAESSWRPPMGDEILFARQDISLHAVNLMTGQVRTIVAPSSGRWRGVVGWSPDGSQIAYREWVDSDDLTVRTHIIAADGTNDRILPIPEDAVWEAGLGWSNDGTRLIAIRGDTGGFESSRAVVRPFDGAGTGIEIDYPGVIQPECCTSWAWAPDDSSILGTPSDESGNPLDQVMLDPVSGRSRTLPWSSVSYPSWQRLAP